MHSYHFRRDDPAGACVTYTDPPLAAWVGGCTFAVSIGQPPWREAQ